MNRSAPLELCKDCGRPLVPLASLGFTTPGSVHLVVCIPRYAR